jgi:hypothetical protein
MIADSNNWDDLEVRVEKKISESLNSRDDLNLIRQI